VHGDVARVRGDHRRRSARVRRSTARGGVLRAAIDSHGHRETGGQRYDPNGHRRRRPRRVTAAVGHGLDPYDELQR
jgi:hypothetical protein